MAASKKPDPNGCAPLGSAACKCRAAVCRAFAGMTTGGASYDTALSVAVRIFHHHHPEITIGGPELVERWISPESLH
jgi:hypothetical protein